MKQTIGLSTSAVKKLMEQMGRLQQHLKVPKGEIFVTELFILSDPIWIGDLRTEPKNPFV